MTNTYVYLKEHSDVYSKISGSFWLYYRDEPAFNNKSNINDFPDNNNNSMWFKFKLQITWQAGNGGTKNVKITVAVKYLNNFWRTSEIPLVNCEISLQLK